MTIFSNCVTGDGSDFEAVKLFLWLTLPDDCWDVWADEKDAVEDDDDFRTRGGCCVISWALLLLLLLLLLCRFKCCGACGGLVAEGEFCCALLSA